MYVFFIISCEFSCIHGYCDERKGFLCICSPGWLGAGCELCVLGMECETAEPQLSLILPQAGPLNFGNLSIKEKEDLPKFVYAYGNDFPKVNYSCIFGSTISVRETDIEEGGGGLKLDPFQEQIYWSSPLGRSKPYSISLKIEEDGEEIGSHQLINWTIKVNPSYSALLERKGISNKKPPFAFNSSLPLIVHIYATDTAKPVPLEDLPIWTGRSSRRDGEEGDD
uniref:EGF-like domain-containing protein n=1 Tax=Meloidogyne javanica TaxID=6303 RepID=A0A915LQ05_MELJA